MRIAVLLNIAVPWSRVTTATLARLGHEVHAIDFRAAKTDGHLLVSDPFQRDDIARFASEVQLHLLGSRFANNLRYFTAAGELRRLLRRIGADVVLTLYGGGFATIVRLAGFRPYCIWVVGSDVLLAGAPQRALMRMALGGAARVFANGAYLTERTRALAPGGNVRNLLLGIDLDELPLSVKPPGPCQVLTNRGFNPVYQNDFIVHGLRHLDPGSVAGGDYRVVFASSGPELQRVVALADSVLPPEVRRRVTFAGGVSRDEMRRLLAKSHVFVSMARSDGTATSLLEAMACGLYPVLSDIPQNREWVRPEWNNGILVPLDDDAALAAAMRRAIAVAPDASNAIAFNRRRVEEHADTRRNLQVLTQLLGEVVSTGGRTAA